MIGEREREEFDFLEDPAAAEFDLAGDVGAVVAALGADVGVGAEGDGVVAEDEGLASG